MSRFVASLFFLTRANVSVVDALSSLQIKEDTTKSEVTFNLGLQWLQNCVKDHPLCSESGHIPKLPTRLLEISGGESQFIRLIRTSDLDVHPIYMTLSHSWGNAIFLKLTTSTFREMSLGLPTTELPQTFQDACLITRWLECQYLWIDSLCIFQDSEEDWARESSTMGDVYRGSKCNIAASASYDSRGGLFRSRDPALKSCCTAKLKTGHSQMTFSIEEDSSSPSFHERNQPLLKRGWVLQERFLAPRVLHFGSDYIYWECHTIDASEKHPTGAPQYLEKRFKDVSYDLYKLWHRLVTEYSACSLTMERDKLVAISGVAKHIGTQMGSFGDYAAGLVS